MTLPSSVAETPETDSDRVSEERLRGAARDLLGALQKYGFPVSDAATRQLMDGGSLEAQAVHVAAKGLAIALRTTPSLPPRSGGVVEFVRQVLEWASDGIDPDGDDIQRLGVETGLLLKVTYDPDKHDLPEWLKGDVEPGDDYFEYSPAIRSTLADPIPEDPADAIAPLPRSTTGGAK